VLFVGTYQFMVLPPQPAGCVTGTPLFSLLLKKLATPFFQFLPCMNRKRWLTQLLVKNKFSTSATISFPIFLLQTEYIILFSLFLNTLPWFVSPRTKILAHLNIYLFCNQIINFLFIQAVVWIKFFLTIKVNLIF